ncbi:hypothetical protein [Kitasatospora brasiliensis]|uniref:hypothetical protein n=1 Tax=Kitasatospora brasiliensis TaxID=3058040 RepID=UPI00292E6CBB|nr:hypothetical protein [Kitasatospora sp. K002]
MTETPKIFLTGAAHEHRTLVPLDRHLRAHGVWTAFDTEREVVDDILAEPTLQDLGACDAAVVVDTPSAGADEVVRAHIRTAVSFGKPVWRYEPGAPGAIDRLLAKCYGTGPVPGRRPPTHLAVVPGSWRVCGDDDPGVFDLDLGADDTVTGRCTAFGVTGRVTGRWSFDAGQEDVTLTLEVTTGLVPQPAVLELHVIGHSDEAILAEEAHGLAIRRVYTLSRRSS